jgi:capping protein alpha
MQTYIDNQYVSGLKDKVPRATTAVYGGEDGGLTIVISAINVSLRNFWSGSWQSSWNVSFDDGKCIVSGDCKTWCHYFENGNVQMQQSKVFDAEVCTEAGAVEEIAVNVVKHIAACEGSMQQQMEMMYSNMSDETFKDMRRVLPVSGVRFFLKGGCGGVPVPVCLSVIFVVLTRAVRVLTRVEQIQLKS